MFKVRQDGAKHAIKIYNFLMVNAQMAYMQLAIIAK